MKTIIKLIIGIAAIALILVGAVSILKAAGVNTPFDDVADSVKTTATNAVIDATGIKSKAQDVLEASAPKIVEATGMPLSAVNAIVQDIDIESWQATTLPENVVPVGEQDFTYDGVSAMITTYDDPSVVTISSNGAEITLEVPATSQGYLKYLAYLD